MLPVNMSYYDFLGKFFKFILHCIVYDKVWLLIAAQCTKFFQWQSKGDLHGAEEYYFRSTQANPEDGEVLVQYAKLVWQLHLDQDRALSYFERAARASPENR